MASPPGSPPSAAANHISRCYERLIQLRAILLSSSPDKLSTPPAAISLLDKALGCLAAALSELQAIPPYRVNASAGAGAIEDSKTETNPHKRRKIQSWTVVTSVPHFDGHQWRKYGQKHIDRAEFPRSYFKCTYRNDQGCPATKTVQKKEGDDADPPNYQVRYRMQHTCKPLEADGFPFIMDSSVVINRSKTPSPNCSREPSASGGPTASPEQLLPPLNASDFVDDCSLWGQVHFMEPMLHPTSAEPRGDEDGGGGGGWSPGDQRPSPCEFDFDWQRLVGCDGELDAILF